jgi:hypothetical protein
MRYVDHPYSSLIGMGLGAAWPYHRRPLSGGSPGSGIGLVSPEAALGGPIPWSGRRHHLDRHSARTITWSAGKRINGHGGAQWKARNPVQGGYPTLPQLVTSGAPGAVFMDRF